MIKAFNNISKINVLLIKSPNNRLSIFSSYYCTSNFNNNNNNKKRPSFRIKDKLENQLLNNNNNDNTKNNNTNGTSFKLKDINSNNSNNNLATNNITHSFINSNDNSKNQIVNNNSNQIVNSDDNIENDQIELINEEEDINGNKEDQDIGIELKQGEKEEKEEEEEKKPPKEHIMGKKALKKLNDSSLWIQWFSGMVDTLGSIEINKDGQVELNISQENGNPQVFSEMKRKFAGGKIRLDEDSRSIKYTLKNIGSKITNMLNIGLFRNPIKQKQFSEVCEFYGIKYKEPKRLLKSNHWILGLYESICSVHLDTDALSLEFTFINENQDIIKHLKSALGGHFSFDDSTGKYKLYIKKETVAEIEEFIKIFKRKSIKLAKSAFVTISPPVPSNVIKERKNSSYEEFSINLYKSKIELWKYFMTQYNNRTKLSRMHLITLNSYKYKQIQIYGEEGYALIQKKKEESILREKQIKRKNKKLNNINQKIK